MQAALKVLQRWSFAGLLVCVVVKGLSDGSPASPSREVLAALGQAGENRGELDKVLVHCAASGDPLKLEAAEFLIANMEPHGYIRYALVNDADEEIPFDTLSYPGLRAAEAAMDALEKEHGKLHFTKRELVSDLKTVTAEFLIENIDLAFQAWRTKPWAAQVSFETFKETILPYRGSNEPAESWRAACLERCRDIPSSMKDPADLREAAGLVSRAGNAWVGFNSLYYMHPTDQGFGEMLKSGRGRCEDITNMTTYALRANVVPSAADYTPWWADRDNNHAWTVILDPEGNGRAGLSHRAAKIYRKTYSLQRDNLAFQLNPDESAPKWLSGKTYRDVTTQYMDTTEVTIHLKDIPTGVRFAYLCVFNGGEWRAIHWGQIHRDTVTFHDMGRRIAYLPAYYIDDELQAAAPPIIVRKDGTIEILDAPSEQKVSVRIKATVPEQTSPDTFEVTPVKHLKAGDAYELSVWEGEWRSLLKFEATEAEQSLAALAPASLYWLVKKDSRRMERIFTIEDSQQHWW